ncbi:hypothetical protein LguiA_036521 [Lonicera macranthoides]
MSTLTCAEIKEPQPTLARSGTRDQHVKKAQEMREENITELYKPTLNRDSPNQVMIVVLFQNSLVVGKGRNAGLLPMSYLFGHFTINPNEHM